MLSRENFSDFDLGLLEPKDEDIIVLRNVDIA
jgi:hypothetical protein